MKCATLLIAFTLLAAPLKAQGDSPNGFVASVIDGLAIASDARDLLAKPTDNDIQAMMNVRSAILKLGQAQSGADAFSKSKDASISEAASAFSGVYGRLARLLGQLVGVQERLVRLDARVRDGDAQNALQQLAEVQIEVSKLGAQTDEAWKLIPEATVMASYVLVDLSRKEGGYLRITSKERADLRAQLERYFKRASLERSSGGHAVEVAPSLLWGFLGQSGWKMVN